MKIEALTAGIRQVNEAYISRPDFDLDVYPKMILAYLLQSALSQLPGRFDFGLYDHPAEVGFVGWFTVGDRTIFYAPAQIAVLEDEKSDPEEPLFP